MFKHDGEGELIGFVIVLGIIAFIIYVLVMAAAFIGGVAAAGGTIYGGGSAIANYAKSFKENVIDSNKKPIAA